METVLICSYLHVENDAIIACRHVTGAAGILTHIRVPINPGSILDTNVTTGSPV